MSEIMLMTNIKGSQWGDAGQSTGEKLTASDIAAACYNLDAVTENLLYARLCGDSKAQNLLKSKLLSDVMEKVEKVGKLYQWNIKKKNASKIPILASIAIDNVCQKPICMACNGTKYLEANQCGSCYGTGVKRDTSGYMANKLGINQTTYLRYYNHIYGDILAMLQTLINHGIHEVNYQTFES